MDFKFGDVLNLMMKTLPFLVFRFIIYFCITLVYAIVTGAGAGIGYLIGKAGSDPSGYSAIGGLIGFGAVSMIIYFFREYLLYLVKAGHIAVLVELLDARDLPGGKSQIDYAQKMVRERFAESSVLFGIDQLIKGVLRAFNRTVLTIAHFLPIPGFQGVIKLANSIINLSLTYLDEVILAYNFRTRAQNPWKSGQTALTLYAQNYKAFLKNAVYLALMIWGLTALVFILIIGPVAALAALVPGIAGPVTIVIAIVFAWGVKQAVIEPVGMTALMLVFFKVTEGQVPNPEWDAKLDKASRKFSQIKSKALDWDRNRGTAGQPVESTTD
ncbi:hypothetical protein JW823_09140 [bacterium]|nr:hypothetical protein [candidate division CSSED10-310 bacterium]